MIAILHDAIDCIEKYRFTTERQGRRVFQEAKRWFRTHDPDWPCSFERVCEVLDLDPLTVRRRLATPTVARRASRVLVDAPFRFAQGGLRSVGG